MNTLNNSVLIKRIIIINFGNDRKELIEWAYEHKKELQQHEIITTAGTALVLEGILLKDVTSLPANSGGEFRALSKLIEGGGADYLFCFGSETPQIFRASAVSQLCTLVKEYNIAFAINKSGADIIIGSLPTPGTAEKVEQDFPNSRPGMRYRSGAWPFKALSAAI